MPLRAVHVVGDVALGPDVENIHLEGVVGPRRERHRAVLLIKRKVLDVNRTGTLEYHHRQPRHVAVVCDDHVGADAGHVWAGHFSTKQEKLLKYINLSRKTQRFSLFHTG